jgi:hypothetical protein
MSANPRKAARNSENERSLTRYVQKFITDRLTYTFLIAGAKASLECKYFGTGILERIIEGMTDETGTYKIELKGSHAEDIARSSSSRAPVRTAPRPSR